MNQKTWKTRAILIGSVALLALAVFLATSRKGALDVTAAAPTVDPTTVVHVPPLPEPKPPAARPLVEVVFAIDTTGSMASLLDGAKRKIWSIANHIASGQPTPLVRIGLVAYRDKQDDYVTKRFELTGDLDSVYEELMSYQAEGGGDTPEHVSKALHEAVNQTQWTQKAMKMVFLVGDAPPHTDYRDGFNYQQIVKDAAASGIVIHTVRAGNDYKTGRIFKEIAHANQGSFTTIKQGGGMAAVSTPWDDRLAELNRELSETTVMYGKDSVRKRARRKVRMAGGAGGEAGASRAGFYSKTRAPMDDADIVDRVARGDMAVGSLKPASMPKPMRRMDKKAQAKYLRAQKAKREKVLKEMGGISAKRDKWIKGKKKAGAFDVVVEEAVSAQAEDHGIAY